MEKDKIPKIYQKDAQGYTLSLRAEARRLYLNGDLNEFTGNMLDLIEHYISQAWFAGMKECDIKPEEISDEEERARLALMNRSIASINGLGIAILALKENGDPITRIFPRLNLWSNRWNEAFNLARSMACADQKLRWDMTPEKEHCDDCLMYNGRVHRASIWSKYGISPQMNSLQCQGFNCGCKFTETDEPALPGRPPNPRGR